MAERSRAGSTCVTCSTSPARAKPSRQSTAADTDHDFAVFISNRPCGDKVTELAKKVGDPRTLFWTPAQLTSQEKDRLLDFAAYRELVKDYQNKDTEDAKEVVQWVANRLRDEIGSIAKIVTDSFGRGQISAADHSSMSFNCQGELLAILTPLVGQVLDGVYVSKEIEFDAPAPFNDAEAIKVINGIVKTGDIPKGTKPNQFTSAADNYGYALGIMKKDGTKQLNTKGNEFVEDLEEWIETQASQGNQSISLETVCKNFTGLGGPNDKNYGLSRRMIDIYLLCLVREGKLRILMSGKGAATPTHIDYTNIADQTFNAALLNSMAKIQRLKAPEGWPVLAPFAAILLDDESLKTIQKDGDITAALDRLKKWREQRKPEVEALIERLDTLMADIQQDEPRGRYLWLPGRSSSRPRSTTPRRSRICSTPSTRRLAIPATPIRRPRRRNSTIWRPARRPGRRPTPSAATIRRSGRPTATRN